ncbi:MAG TPA: hypothetical protein VG842_11260 [Sediminibacterium sp.]|nr:hypothetical protein [Sediminibacterium sp.]
MKKIAVVLGCFLFFLQGSAQTVDEIIAKYEAVSGGRDKLMAIKNLEIFGNLKLDMMGQSMEIPLTLIQEKGKLFRRQVGGIMGMGDSFTMLTDSSGIVFIPPIRGFGGRGPDGGGFGGGFGSQSEPTIIRMQPDEINSQQYELNCDGPFPDLVNYAAKGSTAELAGTGKVNKAPCYKVLLTLKTGQKITYYIDQQNFLVKQMEATGEMAANLTGLGSLMKAVGTNVRKDTKASITVKEYKAFEGIQFPVKYTLNFGPVESEVENTTIKVNQGIEAKWYLVR